MNRYEFHALANIFPLIEGVEFTGLVDDIRANSLREDIWLYEGKILDGRNRYRACTLAGYDIPKWQFKQFDPAKMGDPLAFVLSHNLHRRHLNESQRAMVAAKVANLRHGGSRKPEPEPDDQAANLPLEETAQAAPAPAPITQSSAADTMQVSERSVRDAKKVIEHGSPALAEAVEQGKLAVSSAAQAVGLPLEQQAEIARLAGEGKANVVRTVVKTGRREAKEAALAKKQHALPDAKFGVVYADPEWRFEPFSRETGMDRAPENHYPTSATEEIMARGVPLIAADDCVLFLWGTAPMLQDALRVMEAWGFAYKSHLIWHKLRAGEQRGPGYWVTGEHELLLIGTRGNIPCPAPGKQWRSLIAAPVGDHSEKPDVFAEMIEAYFPNLPKIELNARRARRGWTAWGFEAPLDNLELFGEGDGEEVPAVAVKDMPNWITAAGPEWIERVKAVTDQNGLVHISRSHAVAAEFCLSEEIVQAEHYQAKLRAALAPQPVVQPTVDDQAEAAREVVADREPRWRTSLIGPTALAEQARAPEPQPEPVPAAEPEPAPAPAAEPKPKPEPVPAAAPAPAPKGFVFEIPAFLRRTPAKDSAT